MTRRSEWLVPGMLAILKAGGAYLPIDPEFPGERVQYLLADSRARVVLVDESWEAGNFTAGESAVVCLPDAQKDISGCSAADTGGDSRPTDLAYLIYTSGSTGKPKGVMVTHGNVSNFFAGMSNNLTREPDEHWLAVTSVSFDISVLELLWTLCHGRRVTLKPDTKQVEDFDVYSTGTGRQQMDFSLFYFSSGHYGPGEEKYALLLDSVRFADQHNFKAVWTPERHSTNSEAFFRTRPWSPPPWLPLPTGSVSGRVA
jgi:hypothetical protein